ncbi:hypothetical protein TNCV_3978361 [Trichonephila clavipes]|nr:hypothetical protein TNCV_3978361 [Trichonephila clavipes]
MDSTWLCQSRFLVRAKSMIEAELKPNRVGGGWSEYLSVSSVDEALAELNGTVFTPWVTLPGFYSPDELHPFCPSAPPPRR